MQGILFDLGHTLMEFHGEWDAVEAEGRKQMLAFLQARGAEIPADFADAFTQRRDEEARKSDITAVEFTAEEAFRETARKFNQNGNLEPLISGALSAYFQPEEECWKPYPDALDIVKMLKERGYRLGIISNATDHPFILRCVRKFGFEPYFDSILSSAVFHSRKPHPQIFWSVANRWKMPYPDLVMIGDQLYYDIFGAHQAGMNGIWLERSNGKAYTYIPEELKSDPRLVPDASVRELSEIPEILLSLS